MSRSWGGPDHDELCDEASDYEVLLDECSVCRLAGMSDDSADVWVLSLTGQWRKAHVKSTGVGLRFQAGVVIEGGTSGRRS